MSGTPRVSAAFPVLKDEPMIEDKIDKVLADLARERETLEAEIETMIGGMAAAPAEARASGEWAERGAATKRYLELTERLGEVEQAIIDLNRQRAASGPPPTKH
jgi:hypothetical protein